MPRGHIPELDGVRGVACLLVVVWHLFVAQLPSAEIPPVVSTVMIGGVDLFFVLSGFLIGGILLDTKGNSNFFRSFWLRRTARILPAYSLLLLSYCIALAIEPYAHVAWLEDWLLRSPVPLWSYLTFTQNYFMAFLPDPGAFWVQITWSLGVEEQFYLCFPALVYLLRRSRLVLLAIACLIVAAFIRNLLWKFGGTYYSGYFPTPARIDALMFGFLVAVLVRNGTLLAASKQYRIVLDIGAAGVLVIIVDHRILDWWPTLSFTSMALIFSYALLRIFTVDDGLYRRLLRSPLLVGAGLISYAWYLFHQAVNGLVHGLLLGQIPALASYSDFGAAILALVLSAGLATASTVWIELPIRVAARRRSNDGRTDRIVTA